MKWKRISDEIVAFVLSIAYTITTLLIVIGPLHANKTGSINSVGMLAIFGIIFWIVSLIITWGLYFYLKKKTKILFFILFVVGIILIIAEIYMWGWIGSYYIG